MHAMEGKRPVSHHQYADALNAWWMARAGPDPGLLGVVDGYSDYSESTAGFSARRELASTEAVLLFNLGDPIDITGANGLAVSLGVGDAFVAGIAEATSLSRSNGGQSGIHVHMPWHGVARVCGLPLSELANRVVRFDDLAGMAARTISARLMDTRDMHARFALLDRFLLKRMADGAGPPPDIVWAARRLAANPAASITALAEASGWSQRHFIGLFRAATGHSPRQFARLARFEIFWRRLQREPDAPMAELALESGYFDQPHLNRDTRFFAGATPCELRRRLIPGDGGFVDS